MTSPPTTPDLPPKDRLIVRPDPEPLPFAVDPHPPLDDAIDPKRVPPAGQGIDPKAYQLDYTA